MNEPEELKTENKNEITKIIKQNFCDGRLTFSEWHGMYRMFTTDECCVQCILSKRKKNETNGTLMTAAQPFLIQQIETFSSTISALKIDHFLR